ncbi:hypothetical protein HQ496_07635 [bacterium]|nr:hypothetical protein [bacterium]
MPLTELQSDILAVISTHRTPENYIAGDTTLHFEPNSTRFSRDLDIFHDALEAVAPSYERDRASLEAAGFHLEIIISQPGFIRAIVRRGTEATQIDWARDSAWRFMPVVKHEKGGFLLHPVDVATSKILALVGRNEPRDYVDALEIIETILPLGPLVWAAVAKDPGFSPTSLLEHLRRQGRHRPEDYNRLDLVKPFDPVSAKQKWMSALEQASNFIASRPPEESGCLYWDVKTSRFTQPDSKTESNIIPHFGRSGGILPRPSSDSIK